MSYCQINKEQNTSISAKNFCELKLYEEMKKIVFEVKDQNYRYRHFIIPFIVIS